MYSTTAVGHAERLTVTVITERHKIQKVIIIRFYDESFFHISFSLSLCHKSSHLCKRIFYSSSDHNSDRLSGPRSPDGSRISGSIIWNVPSEEFGMSKTQN